MVVDPGPEPSSDFAVDADPEDLVGEHEDAAATRGQDGDHSCPGLKEKKGGTRPELLSFGVVDIRLKNRKKVRTKGGSEADSVTSKLGPVGRKPGTRRQSVSSVRSQGQVLSSWLLESRSRTASSGTDE